MNPMTCECSNWARSFGPLMTKHHPNCEHYAPHGDAKEIIKALLAAIRDWGADEDGIHPGCCDAYDRAAFFVGEMPLPIERNES